MSCMRLIQKTILQRDKIAMHEARRRQRTEEHNARSREWNTWRNINNERHNELTHSAHLRPTGSSPVKVDTAPNLRPISPTVTIKRLQFDTEVALREFVTQSGTSAKS